MIIYNATIITWQSRNQIFENYGIRITGDRITEIDKSELLISKYAGEESIDAKGQLLMPGLICAHTHFYGLFSRGLAFHGDAPADFWRFSRNYGGRSINHYWQKIYIIRL